jgi:hypothetical protein
MKPPVQKSRPLNDVLLVRSSSEHTAEVFSYRFDHGWAIFTICEATGELQITSDWGNASFRWNMSSLGPPGTTLKSFLADCNSQYILGKLGHEGDFKDEVDVDHTIATIKYAIIDTRRRGSLRKEEARDLYDDALEFEGRLKSATYGHESTVFFTDMPRKLSSFLCDAHEYIETRATHKARFWETKLLPFFQARLRNEPMPFSEKAAGFKFKASASGVSLEMKTEEKKLP